MLKHVSKQTVKSIISVSLIPDIVKKAKRKHYFKNRQQWNDGNISTDQIWRMITIFKKHLVCNSFLFVYSCNNIDGLLNSGDGPAPHLSSMWLKEILISLC